MKKLAAAALFLMTSTPAIATDYLQCDYAKANISQGSDAPMIPLGVGKIESNDESFKAIRPSGSHVTSPSLSEKKQGMLYRDDGTKIFVASPNKTEFAVTDRIGRTTEQWASCRVDKEIEGKHKVDADIALVEKLSGEKARSYFLSEKHAFTTNCMTWGDVTLITGKNPAMLIAGAVHMGGKPKWDGKEYSFNFNGGSMMARFNPSEPTHKLLIQAGDNFYGCGPSVVDHNYD